MPVEILCKVCGNPFMVPPHDAKIRVACSKECANKWHSEVMKGHEYWGGGAPKGHPAWGGFENRFKKGHDTWNKGLPSEMQSNFGKPMSEEQKKKISEARMGSPTWNKGVPDSEETRRKKREAQQSKIKQDPTYTKRRLRAMNIRPTRPERQIMEIIKNNNLPFKYVGDGQIIIGNLNPDFIHSEGKRKVIEVFGRVYHDPEAAFFKVLPSAKEETRIERLKKEGYDCLVLWDDEIEEASVLNQISDFMGDNT